MINATVLLCAVVVMKVMFLVVFLFDIVSLVLNVVGMVDSVRACGYFLID